MKLKCSKCGKIVNKRKDIFEVNIGTLRIDPEDYKRIYVCRACRPYKTLDWWSISRCIDLDRDADLIEKYKSRLSWYEFYEYHEVTEAFIEKYIDYARWDAICRYQKLSEQFIEKHADKVNWPLIWFRQKFPPEFIEKHIDKADGYWGTISACQKLPESFIEKYQDKVDWAEISRYQKLTPEFIAKHIDKITRDIFDNGIYKTLPETVKLLLETKFEL